MNKDKLKFYVLNYDVNKRQIVHYNIFNNIHVYRETLVLIDEFNEGKLDFDGFVKELIEVVQWQEAHRREYEILVGDVSETNLDYFEKWNCFGQFESNAEAFAHYLLGV